MFQQFLKLLVLVSRINIIIILTLWLGCELWYAVFICTNTIFDVSYFPSDQFSNGIKLCGKKHSEV